MKRVQGGLALYNVLLPIWLLLLFPQAWLIALPANFLIDSLVLWLALRHYGVEGRRQAFWGAIWKAWGFGFLSDFIGVALLAVPLLVDALAPANTPFSRWWTDAIANPVTLNPFETPGGFLWTLAAVLLAGWCIYCFNRRFSFRSLPVEAPVRKKLALCMAVCTMPYLFFLPTIWLY